MLIAALAALLTMTPQDATLLAFLHGDEEVVTWLDQASVRRTGDRVRSRVLRVRHANQAFWLVEDVDCIARTSALVATKGADGEDKSPPSMEGQGEFYPIRQDNRMARALLDGVCDGVFVDASIPAVRGAAAATAALDSARAAAVKARPLELIVVLPGQSPVIMDRATLTGGGPQWEVRSLKMTDGRGVWSGWEVDCTRNDLAMDLRWTAPLVNGGYGPVIDDESFDRLPAADAGELALVEGVCDPRIWQYPVLTSIDAAIRAAGTNPG